MAAGFLFPCKWKCLNMEKGTGSSESFIMGANSLFFIVICSLCEVLMFGFFVNVSISLKILEILFEKMSD